MSGELKKLDRDDGPYELRLWQNDTVDFWQHEMMPDRLNVNFVKGDGERVFTLMGLTTDQMAELYTRMGEILGKCPNMAMRHCRQLYEKLKQFFPEEPPRTDWDIPAHLGGGPT
jgi:hypothetical protein